MAFQPINLGVRGDNQTGDDVNIGGDKINDNFQELYDIKLESVVAGTGITIDATDPINPIINGTSSITNTSDLTNDGSDGSSTYVENDELGSLALLDTISSTEIDNAAVTLSKMSNATAFSILGNNTGSAATPSYLTTSQVRSLLNIEDGATADQMLSIIGDQLTISGSGGNTITIPTGGGGVVVDSTIQDGSNNPVTNNAIRDALVDINSWVASGNIQSDKIQDGSGSGLDADLLDGVQGANYARTDIAEQFNGSLTVGDGTAFGQLYLNGDVGGGSPHRIRYNGNQEFRIRDDVAGVDRIGITSSGVITANGSIVWTAGNDGPGSGLDADTLDSIQASSFLRSDIASTKTSGILKFNDNISLTLGTGNDATLLHNGTTTNLDLLTSNFVIRDNTTTRFTFNRSNGNLIITGDLSVSDEVYGPGWNDSLEVPTKNAIYDKIESLSTGGSVVIDDSVSYSIGEGGIAATSGSATFRGVKNDRQVSFTIIIPASINAIQDSDGVEVSTISITGLPYGPQYDTGVSFSFQDSLSTPYNISTDGLRFNSGINTITGGISMYNPSAGALGTNTNLILYGSFRTSS